MRTEGSSITRYESEIVSEIVIKPKVEPVCLDTREVIPSIIFWEELLHAADKLCTSEDRWYRKLLEEICRLDPIPLTVVAVITLGLYIQRH
jgi:hypothetical protein